MARRIRLEDDVTPSQEVADAIITGQEKAVGELAYTLANQVQGLHADPGSLPELHGDETDILDRLVNEYAAVSGVIGPRLCFLAAESVLARHPELRIPAFAAFEVAGADGEDEGGRRKRRRLFG